MKSEKSEEFYPPVPVCSEAHRVIANANILIFSTGTSYKEYAQSAGGKIIELSDPAQFFMNDNRGQALEKLRLVKPRIYDPR